jgi:tRNA dimethylallyltransferase
MQSHTSLDGQKYLIVIAGATASGKTRLAVEIARFFGTVVVNADSRQVYQAMRIGTARPLEEELQGVPHFCLGHLSLTDPYNAALFEKDALDALEKCFLHQQVAVLAGGTGLYIQAVCQGLDPMPDVTEAAKIQVAALYAASGLEGLQQGLAAADPVYFSLVDLQNTHRLLRALEVCFSTGQPFSSFRKARADQRPFQPIKIGIAWEREALYQRIDQRVDSMLQEGLLEEARALYPFRHLKALQTVGYEEIFAFLNGETTLEEAIRLIKRNTRHYAKRQLTWFRRDPSIRWFPPDGLPAILAYLQEQMQA